jgi:hypothetical protein
MSEIGEHITELLDKEMDRKRFLQMSGAIFLAAFGISGLISVILSHTKTSQPTPTHGYGTSRFGK